MSEFVLLNSFPDNAKAIGSYFDSVSFYSLKKETYLTFNEIIDKEISCIDNDSDCEFGKVLFSVVKIDDNGDVIRCSEDDFFKKLNTNGSILGDYSLDEPDKIIELFSSLKDIAIKDLNKTVIRNGCDAHYPTLLQYFFNQENGIIGCQIGGSGYALNSTPDFKKYPNLVKFY